MGSPVWIPIAIRTFTDSGQASDVECALEGHSGRHSVAGAREGEEDAVPGPVDLTATVLDRSRRERARAAA